VDKRGECEKRREERRERMDKYFSSAYRGDPGVPHADPVRFVNIWFGCLAFTACNWVNPYFWHTGSTSFKYLSFPFILFTKLLYISALILAHTLNQLFNSILSSYA